MYVHQKPPYVVLRNIMYKGKKCRRIPDLVIDNLHIACFKEVLLHFYILQRRTYAKIDEKENTLLCPSN